jgi:DNA polymerase-1
MMRNPYEEWYQYHIEKGEHDLELMIKLFQEDKPLTGGSDTETTGLHIKKDKPFLIQFGWLVPKQEFGRVFTFYPTPENMKLFFELASKLKYFVFHNAKFDLNMITNIGYGKQVQSMTNLCDSTTVARLSIEAIPAREGGDSLELKKLGAKYIHPDATRSEAIIKDELKKLKAEGVKVLTAALKQFDHPDDMEYKVFRKDTGNKTTSTFAKENPNDVEWKLVPSKWNKKRIEDWMKDPTLDVDLLPDDVREVWVDWQEEYPEPTYEDVDRDIMIKYGAEDIITMLEFFKHAFPFILKRKQLSVLEMESKCILPMYRMERVGLKADMKYLEESKARMKAYITQLRNEMYEIVTEKITVNQHPTIKRVFKDKWGIELESDDATAMSDIMEEHEGQPKRLAELIKTLRSLEKWYSTYVKRTIQNASYDGKVYTQINSAGAVSGRMSSDLQQNPKDAIFDLEGNELFHPRKAFVVDTDTFELNAYIDYSQVELRVSADYTIKVSGGDVNLCRAYIPFRCKHYKTGEIFNIRKDKDRWGEMQPSLIKSAWLVPETNEPWTPTDMHSETTHNALVILGYRCDKKYEQYEHPQEGAFGKVISKDKFKSLRGKLGKRFNFSKTYGVGLKTAMKNLKVTEEVALALIKGYEAAFPGLITYQKAIEKAHAQKGYVFNAYGMRYYMQDTRKSYKLANHVIQGSCASAFKMALIALDDYILKNNLQSKLILPVHDEQIFGIVRGEKHIIPKLIEIMQSVFLSWCLIPIISEPEVSYTNWATKEDYQIEGN